VRAHAAGEQVRDGGVEDGLAAARDEDGGAVEA